MNTPFQAGSPLDPTRENPYILRNADTQTIENLRSMDYLLLIEPRQQGKTSLIFRLMNRPELANYAFVYIDIGTLSKDSASGWYHTLCTRIMKVLQPRLNWSNPPDPPKDHSEWETYLHSVGHQAAAQDVRVVIALDEIGGASFTGSSEFFKVLHAVRTSRVPYPEFKLITFLLAGAFHPQDLIEDERVSPFNVACQIDLEDFTPAQTLELVAKGPWLKHKDSPSAGQPKPTKKVKLLAERIHYWTDGQPLLTQLFCKKLGDKALPQDVDDLADTFAHQDDIHILPLVQRVVTDPPLHKIVNELLDGRPKEYKPGIIPDLGRLALTGAIKPNKSNLCIIRNRLYEKAFGKDPWDPPIPDLYGTGNRWAVVVGVNEYEDQAHYGDLQVCVKDAEAIHDQLIAVGYKPDRIKILTDHTTEALPTRDNILVALSAIAEATEPDDLLVFYYSGHGDQDGRESYLVARNGKKLSLEDTAVKASRIKQVMERAPARAKVIILDACHSGANIKGKSSQHMSEEFIRRVFEQAEGLAILASCKQGQVSYEWETNERSVFTYYLLEALQGHADLDHKGFVTIQDANRHLSNRVRLWASQRNRSQTPTLQAEVAGEIILAYLPANE